MNKQVCQYVIVRFTPFIETGEFANVGIVMLSATDRVLHYQLMTRRYSKITQFFNELDARVYTSTMRTLNDELKRLNKFVAECGGAKQTFGELVRPREAILRFSEPRTMLASDPVEALSKLYGYYVERNFVTKQYQEELLEKKIKSWLTEAKLDKYFSARTVGDDIYHATFPFVKNREEQPYKIIKPLDLGQDTSTKIIDHGGRWVTKLNQLKKRHALPNKVLFTVAGPKQGDVRQQAYKEAVEMLVDTGAMVLPYLQQNDIIEFARG